MTDLTVTYGRIREQTRFDLTGAEVVEIVVPFHIGNHGPFTEKLTKQEYAEGRELAARVEAIKKTLQGLPK